MPLPPVVSVNWTLSQSGVGSPYGWNISNSGNTIRFDVQDSANCGGPNGNVQRGTASAVLTAQARFNMLVSLTGLGERQDPGFENMTLRYNGTNIITSTSPGGGQGCAAGGPVSQTILVPGPYFIAKNSSNTFELSFTTADNLFHVGCFYQCNLTFQLLDPPEIISFSANPNPQTNSNGTPTSDTILTWATFGAETLSINQGVGDLSTNSGNTGVISVGVQSIVGSLSPAQKTYTLTATNTAGSVTQDVTVSIFNDNTPSTSWNTIFSNLEPSTEYEFSLGQLQGVDMNTIGTVTGDGNFLGTSFGGSFSSSINFVPGSNVVLKFTTLPFNTDISGETGIYGKTNTKIIPVTIGTQSFNVTVRTRPPIIAEDFNYFNNTGQYPYEDIDLITNNPSQYSLTNVVTTDNIDIPVEIKTDNPNVQVNINGTGWTNVRSI
jgi:hypothetical protein